MFGLFKEREWARQTEDSMAFLLAFRGEKFVRLIFKHYPGARKLAIEKARAGEPINRTASEILRSVLACEIEKLSQEKQALVAAYMTSSDEEELQKPPLYLADLCRAYATMMFRESDLKKLDEMWVTDCLHDVYHAAKGMTSDQRSADRMMRAFERASPNSVRQK